MTGLELDVNVWAQTQFGDCNLGDVRRTRRAVLVAAQVAADPSGTTPEQTEAWSDCKAAYRLFGNSKVTFQALAEPHWRLTRDSLKGRVLLIDDTTTVSFGSDRRIAGMGITTDARHPGFLLHSALAIDPSSGQVLGLVAQTIRHRRLQPKHETARQRLAREDRESRLWGDVIDLVGPPPEGVTYTHVCDRGADNFEVFCKLAHQRHGWVIRAAQLDRRILTPTGDRQRLDTYLASLSVLGRYELTLRGTAKHPPRTALLEVRASAVTMPRPQDTSPFVKSTGIRQIAMHVVEVREVSMPKQVEPLHWVLYARQPVDSFRQAWQVIADYEQRPVIEDYHKALKTGCRVEERLYETAPRLEAVTGVLSVVAVRLLQLKTVARTQPECPAAKVVPVRWIEMLECVRKGRSRRIGTVYEFYRALAKLGGFLGRKHDGEPGWITIWRGFEKLQLMIRGSEAATKKCG